MAVCAHLCGLPRLITKPYKARQTPVPHRPFLEQKSATYCAPEELQDCRRRRPARSALALESAGGPSPAPHFPAPGPLTSWPPQPQSAPTAPGVAQCGAVAAPCTSLAAARTPPRQPPHPQAAATSPCPTSTSRRWCPLGVARMLPALPPRKACSTSVLLLTALASSRASGLSTRL